MSRIIVKYVNGRTKAGRVHSFNINQPVFYVQVEDEAGKVASSTENFDSVKEVDFLKSDDTSGSAVRTEKIGESVFAGAVNFRLTVEFKDGSVLTGTAHKYNPNDRGFYVVPLNPTDRSERIFVVAHAAKRVDSAKLFGKILVDEKKISQEKLETGLKKQQEYRDKKIGAILREQNLISDEQLRDSLKQQKEKQKLLGNILVEAGYITTEQLNHALHFQLENRKKKLGQILVEFKFLTPNDICIALATQLHCGWIDLSEMTVPREIVALLPEDVVKRLEVIPVEKNGKDILVVATSQPQNSEIGVEVRKATSLKVELAVAYELYITRNIAFHFPGGPQPLREVA